MVFLKVTDGSPASWETEDGTGFHAQHRLRAAALVAKEHWANDVQVELTALPV